MKFKKGDRVRYVGKELSIKDKKGVVVHIIDGRNVGVSWFGFESGHNLENNIPDSSGWYVSEKSILLDRVENWKNELF